MRNKVVKKLLMIAMAVTMISGTSLATVYANANPPAEETTTAVVEETTTEKSKDTEKAEDTGRVTGESNNSAFSTPGNAQLVDDKENDDTKQFLTIQTKKGNTFYMVIDRSSNTENVYMMSLVDENDLAEFLDETNLDSRQIYFVNQIVEYIVHNGMMTDFSVLQEAPFTDRGSITEVFTDVSVWLGIKNTIDMINANALAA